MVPNPYDMVNKMREEREAAEKDGSIKKADVSYKMEKEKELV